MSHIKGKDETTIKRLVQRYGVTNVAAEAHEQAGKRVLHNAPRRRRTPTYSRNNLSVDVWEERDRLHIELYAHRTGEPEQRVTTVAEWWDDDARQMFEDGFFNARNLEQSVIDYAKSVGLVKIMGENPVRRGKGKFVHIRVRSPRRFVTRSLRTVKTDGGRVTVGHLKGEQRRTRTGRTRQTVQAILRPKGRKRTVQRGNPPLAILGNPPNGAPKGTFMGKVSYIEYRHDYDHEPFYHHFRPAAYLIVRNDGSAVLYHPQQKLWKFFEVK